MNIHKDTKTMEYADYEATSTLPSDHFLLQLCMPLHPKDMKDPNMKAIA